MNNLITVCLLLLFSVTSYAQTKTAEGKVVYTITYEQEDSTKKQTEASNATVYFTKNMLRMEMKTGSGYESVTIINVKAKTSIMLIEIAGKKYAVANNRPDRKSIKDAKKQKPIEYKNESKVIAGYNCKRADVQLKNNKMYSVFYTEEIESRNAAFNSPLYEIDGFLLEFWVNSGNRIIKMSAKEIITEPVEKKLFEVPDDYILTSREELRTLFQSK